MRASVCGLLWILALACTGPGQAQTNPVLESPAISQIRGLITRINVLNGLGLTREQLLKLRSLLTEAEDVRQMMALDQAKFEARCGPAFEELRQCVWAGRTVSTELYDRCKMLDDGNRILQNRYLKLLQPLEAKLVSRVLTPAQVALVEGTSECMVPAPDLQDPEKIGQAGNRDAYSQLLKDIRKTPAAELPGRERELVATLVTGIENDFGLLGTQEGPRFERRCHEVIAEARALSAVSFSIRAGELAAEVDPQVQDIRLKNKRVAFDTALAGGLGKPGRYLLNGRLLPVVVDRCNAPTPEVPVHPLSSLKVGPVAESCGPKGCAVATLRSASVPGEAKLELIR